MADKKTVGHENLNNPILEVLADVDDARVYLEQCWIGSSQLSLRQAFKASGLTIAQVAERMGVSVRMAARYCRDVDGNITLAKYAAFMSACGVSMFDIEYAPTGEMRQVASPKAGTPLQ